MRERLVVRTIRSAGRHRVVGIAAELAFFLLLSIPPAILIFAGFAGYVGKVFGTSAQVTLRRGIVNGLGTFLQPSTMRDFVRPAVDDLFARGRADILSVGALLALWSASRATNVFMYAMDVAHAAHEHRAGWRRRLSAIGVTIAGLAFLAVVLPFILAGPRLGRIIADGTALPDSFATAWRILYWPVAAVAGVATLASVYRFALSRRSRWRAHLPGAALAAVLWIAAAFGLRAYAAVAFGKGSAFGPLAAPIILLLWLYVIALAVLLGAELNAEAARSGFANAPSVDSVPAGMDPPERER
jgi:membrane protein